MAPSPAPDADRLPAITVVVPTRNRAERIAENISSVLANAYPDFRVLVVDQSDDDRTERTVRELASSDGRLRYIRQPGTGAARARNLGAWEASDPLVAFVDVANVLNHRNLRNPSYTIDGAGRVRGRAGSLLPFVPSGGLVVEF
jgi:glycosyltransferase involved in cell wall biosynthesis